MAKKQDNQFIHVVGRRREAVARVRLYSGADVSVNNEKLRKGDIFVNNVSVEKYFPGEIAKVKYLEPFRTTNTLGKYIFTIKVEGGGKSGQMDAMIHGISRALVKLDKDNFRLLLKKRGFLTRDARVRERRKIGMGGKARRKRQSPKR